MEYFSCSRFLMLCHTFFGIEELGLGLGYGFGFGKQKPALTGSDNVSRQAPISIFIYMCFIIFFRLFFFLVLDFFAFARSWRGKNVDNKRQTSQRVLHQPQTLRSYCHYNINAH